MAKARKPRRQPSKPAIPFEWETEVALPGSGRVRTARPEICRGEVDGDSTLSDAGREAEVITARARIWRTALPPMLAVLNPSARAAVLDYAEAVETVGASGGTSDPTGGGGGGGAARGPSLRAICAAERLRHMHAALAGGEMVVPVKDARRMRRGGGLARVPLRQLAQWVAVDGLGRREILNRSGAAPSNEMAQGAATLAIVDMGERLAICCGYTEGPTPVARIRNMPGRDL
jgi:hypothetical protein